MKSVREPSWPFASAWDEALASAGPATIFTLDPKGLLRADAERTREVGLTLGVLAHQGAYHYIVTDRVTGVLMYLYVTHPALAERQLRADAVQVPDAATAIREVNGQWEGRGSRTRFQPNREG